MFNSDVFQHVTLLCNRDNCAGDCFYCYYYKDFFPLSNSIVFPDNILRQAAAGPMLASRAKQCPGSGLMPYVMRIPSSKGQ